MFAYCGNNPVSRKDSNGDAWETVFDIISLGASIVDVIENPTDPWAWAGLVGDAVDVVVPFVAGVGEVARAASTANKVVDTFDDAYDATRAISNSGDIVDAAGDATRRTDFYVTPNGEAIPGTISGFNNNLSMLDYNNGKFYGADSSGPIRIRANEIHPGTPGFSGIPNPLHTVPHFHIDRRANGLTGPWISTFSGPMEMLK